jgi:hypothetical protein
VLVRLSWATFSPAPKFFCGNLRIGLRKSYVCAPREEEATDVFRAEVDFEQVLYGLALHAQSLFTAAACLGWRDELVLPGGDSAADLVSDTLLKLLDPFNTSVTWSATKGPPTTAGVLAYLREVLKRDFLDLVRFAKLCGTSLTASAVRLITLTPHRAAVVWSQNQKILLSKLSAGFVRWIRKGEVRENSFAGQYYRKQRVPDQLAPVPASAWPYEKGLQEGAQILGTIRRIKEPWSGVVITGGRGSGGKGEVKERQETGTASQNCTELCPGGVRVGLGFEKRCFAAAEVLTRHPLQGWRTLTNCSHLRTPL